MRGKRYATEKVEAIAEFLTSVPRTPARFLSHVDAVMHLSPMIRELHFRKNYDEKQIAALLKEQGMRISQKEVRSILERETKKRREVQ